METCFEYQNNTKMKKYKNRKAKKNTKKHEIRFEKHQSTSISAILELASCYVQKKIAVSLFWEWKISKNIIDVVLWFGTLKRHQAVIAVNCKATEKYLCKFKKFKKRFKLCEFFQK